MIESHLSPLIREVLNRHWDPIGVRDVVDDEYESYIPRIADLLATGTDQPALGRHLHRIECDTMGLRGNPQRCNHAAKLLLIEYHSTILCPELQAVLRTELAAGNQIAESSVGWPQDNSVFIRLTRAPTTDTPNGVDRRDVNDPHYWEAELYHHKSGHVLVW